MTLKMYEVKVLGGFHSSSCTGYCCWVVLLCIIIWWICIDILEESVASIWTIGSCCLYVFCYYHILSFSLGSIFYQYMVVFLFNTVLYVFYC